MDDELDGHNRVSTARRMLHLADQLRDAITSMEERAIRIPANSRLPAVVRLLRHVSCDDRFPESRTQLTTIVHAARDAQEFAEISRTLLTEEFEPVRRNLQQAVFGTLGQTRDRAHQYQSELWVGAMLVRSGASVAVRKDARDKCPDFVLQNGDKEFAVEVKRPASVNNARRLVSEAAAQLRHQAYQGGLLVVDLTDCVGSQLTVCFGSGPPDMASTQAKATELTNSLREAVFDDMSERIRERRRHVFGVTTFVRAAWWDLDGLSQMYSMRYILPVSFSRSDRREQDSQTRSLAALIDKGMREIGLQDLGRHDVTFDAWIRS